MADRRVGLDYNHCKLVIQEIAKFHALSWNYVVKKNLKSIKDDFPFAIESVFCSDQKELLSGMLAANFTLMSQKLEDAVGADSELFQGLMRFKEDPTQFMFMYLTDGDNNENTIRNLFRVKPEPPSSKNIGK